MLQVVIQCYLIALVCILLQSVGTLTTYPTDSVNKEQFYNETRSSFRAMQDKPPVLIIPGILGSKMIAWQRKECKTGQTIEIHDVVWLNLQKLIETLTYDKRCWIDCLKLNITTKPIKEKDGKISQEDLSYDPNECKIRSDDGLNAIAEITSNKQKLFSTTSVFTKLITLFASELNYDINSLLAAPYDWRLAPIQLEKRDRYFTKLKIAIESHVATHKKPFTIICHSMGNNMFLYFLSWMKKYHCFNSLPYYKKWMEKHVYTYIGFAAPLLGAAGSMKAVFSGHSFGLPISDSQARELLITYPSTHFLNLRYNDNQQNIMKKNSHKSYPRHIHRQSGTSRSIEYSPENIVMLETMAGQPIANYTLHDIVNHNIFLEMMKYFDDPAIPHSYQHLLRYYDQHDPLALLQAYTRPYVKHIYMIYGVDIPTEIAYKYKLDRSNNRSTPTLDEIYFEHSMGKYHVNEYLQSKQQELLDYTSEKLAQDESMINNDNTFNQVQPFTKQKKRSLMDSIKGMFSKSPKVVLPFDESSNSPTDITDRLLADSESDKMNDDNIVVNDVSNDNDTILVDIDDVNNDTSTTDINTIYYDNNTNDNNIDTESTFSNIESVSITEEPEDNIWQKEEEYEAMQQQTTHDLYDDNQDENIELIINSEECDILTNNNTTKSTHNQNSSHLNSSSDRDLSYLRAEVYAQKGVRSLTKSSEKSRRFVQYSAFEHSGDFTVPYYSLSHAKSWLDEEYFTSNSRSSGGRDKKDLVKKDMASSSNSREIQQIQRNPNYKKDFVSMLSEFSENVNKMINEGASNIFHHKNRKSKQTRNKQERVQQWSEYRPPTIHAATSIIDNVLMKKGKKIVDPAVEIFYAIDNGVKGSKDYASTTIMEFSGVDHLEIIKHPYVLKVLLEQLLPQMNDDFCLTTQERCKSYYDEYAKDEVKIHEVWISSLLKLYRKIIQRLSADTKEYLEG